jgi:hypothetical protein
MDSNDRLMVVDASSAVMTPALPEHISAINKVWYEPA